MVGSWLTYPANCLDGEAKLWNWIHYFADYILLLYGDSILKTYLNFLKVLTYPVYHIVCVGGGERGGRGDSRKSDIFVSFHLFLTKKYENVDSKYYFVSALLSLGNSSTARKCDGSIIVLFDPFPSLFYFLLYRSYFHSFFRFLICLVFLPPSFFTPR